MSTSQENNSTQSLAASESNRKSEDDLFLEDDEDQPHGSVQLLREDSGARRDLRRYVRRHLQIRHRKTPVSKKSGVRDRKERAIGPSKKRKIATLRHRWLSRQSRISKHPISDVLLALKKKREEVRPSPKKKNEASKLSVPAEVAKPVVEVDAQPVVQPSPAPTLSSRNPNRKPAPTKKVHPWIAYCQSELRTITTSRMDRLAPKYRWAGCLLAVALAVIGILIGRYDGAAENWGLYNALYKEKSETESLTKNLDVQRTQMERVSRELKSYAEENKALQTKLRQAENELRRFDAVRGGLTVNTVPDGATVKVGGDAVLTTPATFQGLIAQTYPVEVEMEGYEPVTMQAEVKPQQFTDLGSITLVRSLGSLDLKSSPDGANYELTDRNGEKITGKTPMSLETIPAGRYHMKMSAPLYPAMEQEIVVRKGETEKIFWAFGEGELNVKTEPPGADITINGEPKGKSPANLKLQAGTHNVSIQFAPWPPQTKTVQVVKDLPTEVSFTLTMGKVEVRSDKPGTAIWSGDSFLGRTPLQMEIPTAKHDLWAFSPGRIPKNQELELGANESKTAEFKMTEEINAKIDPKGAPSEQYLAIYLSIQEGEKLAADGKRLESYKILTLADEKLRRFRKLFPDFEQAIVLNRIRSLQKTMTDLEEGRSPAKRSGPMIKVEGIQP